MKRALKTAALLTMLVYGKLLFAGGPLVIEGPDKHTPVKYDSPTITLHLESGKLGSRSNADADNIVMQAFDLWNKVGASTIYLKTTELNVDINKNNFLEYLPAPDSSILNADDNLNPVVYDDDGSIIEAFFPDNSDYIAGFAASIYTEFGRNFKEGYAVINGNTLSPLNNTKLKLLVAHEIAHLFGLDHSQAAINSEDPGCFSDAPDNYPLMYPYLCRIDGLHADDISAVSALYPDATPLNANYGTVEGRFVDEAGTAILGANIWAENISTGETVSIVSDYLKQGNGYYKLLLPTGSYTLHANSINTQFFGSSGIGPYTETEDDISFSPPHPITEVNYLGTSDSNEEVITVSPGQTIEINFSSIGTPVILPDNDNNSGTMSYAGLLILFGVLVHRRFAFEPVKIGNKL